MQVDTRERGFSYSYEAPLDMRMDPSQELTRARDRRRVGRAPPGRARCATSARSATPARSRGRSCARRAQRADRDDARSSSTRSAPAIPAPARFAGGHPAKRSFQALRIAVNDELGQLDHALPLAWELLREGGVLAGDLLPLARGPARQALPRRPRAGLRLPAGPAGVRLRARAGGGAADAPLDRALARRSSRPTRAPPPARLRAARKLADRRRA